ncbi:MAG TPA: hypothetical protein VMU95_25440 [Trebonia sp.]|nr:hypothetical protein [Trebonia sp.]
MTYPAPSGEPPRSGGAEGNERLTAITGTILLFALAVEGYTILRIGHLLTLHVFLGMLLLGPVTLKAGSVIYRFARYYTGSPPYRRKGPPAPLLRVIGPVIVLLTASIFGSGIMLAVTGPGNGQWLTIHRLSFIAWCFVMTVHVLAYVPRLPRLIVAEVRGISLREGGGRGEEGGLREGSGGWDGGGRGAGDGGGRGAGDGGGRGAGDGQYVRQAMEVLGGRGARLALLVASLLGGLVIALLTVHLVGNWQPGGP